MRRHLPQPVVVENRPGGGGNIAADLVARSEPDGYTLLLGASSLVQNAAVFQRLPYDPLKDFTPISEVAYYSLVVIAGPKLNVTSVQDVIAAARARPGEITYSSAGIGTPTHLAGELFAQQAGLQMTHVPYSGAAPGQTALLAGQIDLIFQNPTQALPAVRAGQVRAIAVTALERTAELQDVPTVAESGFPGFEVGTWAAVFGPAGLPEARGRVIRDALHQTVAVREVAAAIGELGMAVRTSDSAQLAERMKEDLRKWTEVVQRAGIRAQ